MRKVLAILLAAVMLLSCGATALAAEEASVANSYTVSDISFIVNDQIIELTGVTAVLEAASVDGSRGFRMSVNKDDEPLGELTFTLQDDGLCALHMDSPTLGVKDYGIDLAAILSRSMKSGIDSLVALLQSVDTDSAAQTIINALLRTPSAIEEPVETEAPEMPEATEAPTVGIDAEGVVDVLSECVTNETEQMGGEVDGPDGSVVTIPYGEYEITTVTLDTETIASMLDMVSLNGQPAGLGDAVRNAGVDISVNIKGTTGEAAKLGQFNVTAEGEDLYFVLGLDYSSVNAEDGVQTNWSWGSTSGADRETASTFGMVLTITSTEGENVAFVPAPVDESALVMLSDMTSEEATTELTQSFVTLLTDMLAPLGEEAPAE